MSPQTSPLPRLLLELRGDRSLRAMAELLTANGHPCSRGAVFNWESSDRDGSPSMEALDAYASALGLQGPALARLYEAAGVPRTVLRFDAGAEAA